MNLIVKSHGAGYGPRTALNAKSAGLTLAFAANFASAGERLTKKVAGEHYLAISIPFIPRVAANAIAAAARKTGATTLNIAGNSLHTLRGHGVTQEGLNQQIYETLGIVHSAYPLDRIVSGGQTGADLAGAAAAVALGIDATITLPSGFLQRDVDGNDSRHTEEEIREMIMLQAGMIQRIEKWPSPLPQRKFF